MFHVLTYMAAAAPQAVVPSKWLRSSGGQGQIGGCREGADVSSSGRPLDEPWPFSEIHFKLVWGSRAVVVHAFNLSSREAEAVGSL